MGSVFYVKPSEFEVDHVHAFVAGERYAETHDSVLPHNAFWRDIEFRYARDAHAFSIVHPNFKILLDRLASEHAGNHVPPPFNPPCWTECPVEPPLNPQTIPEPASVVMGITCVAVWLGAAIFLARRDSRK